MTVRVIGEVPIGSINPACVSAVAAVGVATGPTLSSLTATLAGYLQAQVNLTTSPPSLASMLAQAQALVAAIEAAILAGIPPVDVQLTAVAGAIASIEAQIGTLTAQASLVASIPLGATVQAAVYTGPAANFGAEMGAYFGGGVQGGGPASDAVVLCVGASTAQSRAALSAVFGV